MCSLWQSNIRGGSRRRSNCRSSIVVVTFTFIIVSIAVVFVVAIITLVVVVAVVAIVAGVLVVTVSEVVIAVIFVIVVIIVGVVVVVVVLAAVVVLIVIVAVRIRFVVIVCIIVGVVVACLKRSRSNHRRRPTPSRGQRSSCDICKIICRNHRRSQSHGDHRHLLFAVVIVVSLTAAVTHACFRSSRRTQSSHLDNGFRCICRGA